MGLCADGLKSSLDIVARIEPRLGHALMRAGYPAPRSRPKGYETLLRTIVGQQVSIKAAAAVWNRLESQIGKVIAPDALLAQSDEVLRACGLSRQKIGYARSLASMVASGMLDLDTLPVDDEQAIAELVRVKGIGRWSAEIYLLFAEGRPDIWPAGDLAVQIQVGRWMGCEERPGEQVTRVYGEAWRPHRGAVAIFAWHHYNNGSAI